MKKVTQKDIIIALGRGDRYCEIQDAFKISKNSLKLHLRRIRKLGIEPTDPNSCRRHVFGPGFKPFVPPPPATLPITDKQLRILTLIDSGHTMEEIRHATQTHFRKLGEITCNAFQRIGVPRFGKPRALWKAELHTYLTRHYSHTLTMDDPAFN